MSSRWYLLTAAALVLLVGCGGKPPATSGKPERPENRFAVAVAPVTARDLTPTTTVPGRFEAAEVARCTARVAGPVVRVLVGEGAVVKAGQALAELDPVRLRLTLSVAEAAILKTQATADEAARLVVRRQELAKTGLATAEDLDAASARAAQATADLLTAKAQRDRARADLEDAVITAPVAGVIEDRMVDTGQWVAVGAELFTIVRRDPLEIRAQVAPDLAAALAPNQAVTVRAEGQEAAGAIVLVAQAADPATGRVPVLARLSQPPASFRPGAYAEVVLAGTPRRALMVPSSAIRPTERGLMAYLAVEGKAEERPVTTGQAGADGMIEVRSGLAEGEPLIVRGADGLRAGALLATDPARGK